MNINFTDNLLVDICFCRQKSCGCVYGGQIVVDRQIMLEFRFIVDTLSWTSYIGFTSLSIMYKILDKLIWKNVLPTQCASKGNW